MKIKIEFFTDKFIDAISAGIYEVYLKKGKKSELLYIGESVFVLLRCATHLFAFKNDCSYFGFDDNQINDEDITLVFLLHSSNFDSVQRKATEKDLIKLKSPLLQNGISDRMKTVDLRLAAVAEALLD